MMTTTKNLLFVAFLSLLFSSCSTNYYQVYKTKTGENIQTANQQLVYEDENCKISYNLWDNQGDIGFKFYNKTDQNIHVNLAESFFVVNGISHNYYKNRVYTNSNSIGSSVSSGASASQSVMGVNLYGLLQNNQVQSSKGISTSGVSGRSVAYTEEKTIVIPPKTAKIIDEYSINNTLFRDCDLYKYPRKSQIKTLNFNKDNSPLVFSNRIAYTTGESTELTRVENDFYVNAITNYSEKEATERKKDEFCGEKDVQTTNYFKDVAPNKFYLFYVKKKNNKKH